MVNKAGKPTETVITLTLPQAGNAALLIQRGDLAHVRQFTYTDADRLTEAIHAAVEALDVLEADPPNISDPPPEKKMPQSASPPEPKEPTIEIPVKKGKIAIPISYLKVVGGETDASAYQTAIVIAGRLIDGKLWDAKSPIRIADVEAVAKKLSHLKDKELSLFTLEDFVAVGDDFLENDGAAHLISSD